MAKRKKANKAKSLTDKDFVDRYHELGENASALGRELGVSHTAIQNRLKKIDLTRMTDAKAAGVVAGMIHQSPLIVQPANTPTGTIDSFQDGVTAAIRSFNCFANLTNYCRIADNLIQLAEADIQKHMERPGAKLTGMHIDNMTKLLNLATKISVEFHKARKDVLEVEALANFFEAAAAVLERFDPAARQAIFVKLLEIGAYDQAQCFPVSEIPGTPGVGTPQEDT
jgi:hypothetical protein